MAANRLEQFIAQQNIPKHLIDWKAIREWQSGVHKTKNEDVQSNNAPGMVSMPSIVSIPSINEFEELLHQVSPLLTNKAHVNESDLILLNISKDLTIVFCKPPKKSSSTSKNVKSEKEKEDKKTDKVQEEKSEVNEMNENELMILKLVSKSTVGSENTNEKQSTNSLPMSLDGQFNCLLVGTSCCCFGINTPQKKTDEEKMYFDLIFDNISKYVGKMTSKEEIESCKNEIKPLWSLIFKLLNFNNDNNDNDKSWMIGLSMILCVSLDKLDQLSFVKDYISNNTETTNPDDKKTQETKDIVQECMLLLSIFFVFLQCLVATFIAFWFVFFGCVVAVMNMKRKLDESRFKQLIFEVGCFMDLYNLIISNKENSGEILNRFLTYFYYFNEQSFLLSMKHSINGDGLLDISKNSRDNLMVHKALSKYIQEDETFNEKFTEYGFYFNERSGVLRTKLGQVNLFCFLFCFEFKNVWFWLVL